MNTIKSKLAVFFAFLVCAASAPLALAQGVPDADAAQAIQDAEALWNLVTPLIWTVIGVSLAIFFIMKIKKAR